MKSKHRGKTKGPIHSAGKRTV